MNEQQPATSTESPEPSVSDRRIPGSVAPLRIMRHIQVRAALAALIALLAIGSGTAYAATRATSRPIGTGVVVVNTNLGYQNASAAGTGIVLTSSGEILTNNHVIAGATTIRVVVPKTAHTYTARVVGYSTTADVAVLQLEKASSLKTVKTGSASNLKLGARVTAVGNAGATAFMGVQLGSGPSFAGQGATIVGLVPGGPAAAAGLAPGDLITAIAGRAVTGPSDIEPIILAQKPGDKITVTYTDASGQRQT